MKKMLFVLVSVIVLAVLCSGWFGAPTVTDLAEACSNEDKVAGETLTLDAVDYICPVPTATPVVIYQYLVESSLSICDNPQTFGDASHSSWLAVNVFGPAESWKFDGEKWTYTFVPYREKIGFGGSVDHTYKDGFRYPGFGVYKLYLYEGDTEVISDYSADYFHLHFTKLELSCK